MADDRLACFRSASMLSTRSEMLMSRPAAIFRRSFQNASSRLMLVLWPEMTTERFAIVDLIVVPPHASDIAHQYTTELSCGIGAPPEVCAPSSVLEHYSLSKSLEIVERDTLSDRAILRPTLLLLRC